MSWPWQSVKASSQNCAFTPRSRPWWPEAKKTRRGSREGNKTPLLFAAAFDLRGVREAMVGAAGRTARGPLEFLQRSWAGGGKEGEVGGGTEKNNETCWAWGVVGRKHARFQSRGAPKEIGERGRAATCATSTGAVSSVREDAALAHNRWFETEVVCKHSDRCVFFSLMPRASSQAKPQQRTQRRRENRTTSGGCLQQYGERPRKRKQGCREPTLRQRGGRSLGTTSEHREGAEKGL